MKDLVRENGLKERVLVSRTGCLKRCSRGVTAAVYPDNVWYQGLRESDLEQVCREHLIKGAAVDRLLLPDEAPWE
jgi:(2Fe-2S) ferredoxin